MLYRVIRYNFGLQNTITLSIRSDRRWNNEIHRNFMIALTNLDRVSSRLSFYFKTLLIDLLKNPFRAGNYRNDNRSDLVRP